MSAGCPRSCGPSHRGACGSTWRTTCRAAGRAAAGALPRTCRQAALWVPCCGNSLLAACWRSVWPALQRLQRSGYPIETRCGEVLWRSESEVCAGRVAIAGGGGGGGGAEPAAGADAGGAQCAQGAAVGQRRPHRGAGEVRVCAIILPFLCLYMQGLLCPSFAIQ